MDTNVWKHLGGNSARGKKQKFASNVMVAIINMRTEKNRSK